MEPRLNGPGLLLRERLGLLARKYPRYGYRKIHVLLRRGGWQCSRERVQRVWRDAGLRLPVKGRASNAEAEDAGACRG